MINGANAQADAHTDGRERLVKMIIGRLSRGCYEKAPTSKLGIIAGRPTNNGGLRNERARTNNIGDGYVPTAEFLAR